MYSSKMLHHEKEAGSSSSLMKNNFGNWSCLPSIVLDKIYTYLDRPDRLTMSLVCRNWSNEYKSTIFWKTLYLNLSEKDSELNIWPDVVLAQKFRSRFENIEINGYGLKREEIDKAYLQMKLFFEALKSYNGNLRSIKIKNMFELSLCSDDINRYSSFLRCISNFMRVQTNLTEIEFNKTYFHEKDGLDLLILIFENNCNTLNVLTLKNFIREKKFSIVSLKRHSCKYKTLVEWLVGLKTLKTDYSKFFENIIHLLSTQNVSPTRTTSKLSLIKLHQDKFDCSLLNGVPPTTWKQIKEIYPELRLHINLDYTFYNINKSSIFITDNMPIQSLAIRFEKEYFLRQAEIDGLIQQICNCKATEYLRRVSIVWNYGIDDVSNHFIPFLQASRKLETLQLFLRYPVGGIEELLKAWLENRPVFLKSVHLSVTQVVNEADRYFLAILADEYRPKFQSMGIKLVLLTSSL